MKISDKYEINENDFEATESGNVFWFSEIDSSDCLVY